jgi:hypothetical protein
VRGCNPRLSTRSEIWLYGIGEVLFSFSQGDFFHKKLGFLGEIFSFLS